MAMRNFLRKQGKKKFHPVTALSMLYLNSTDPAAVKALRKVMIQWSYQASASAIVWPNISACTARRPRIRRTVGKPAMVAQVIHFVNKPLPAKVPSKTARALLDIEDNTVVPVIRDPRKAGEDSEAVFYFPGCGSERLYSEVGLATQAML